MKGYLVNLDERVRQRIETLRENDEIVRQNEEKIKEIDELVRQNECIIKKNYEKIRENKTKINFNKKKIGKYINRPYTTREGICGFQEDEEKLSYQLEDSQESTNSDKALLANQIMKICEDNLELCKDNLARTIQDRDRIVEIQSMCVNNTKRNRQSLVILQKNIAEMMSIARVLLCLAEEDEMKEEMWRKNGFLKQKGTEVQIGNQAKWKQNLINLLQELFDKRNKVFDYKNTVKLDQLDCNKRKTVTNERAKNKRIRLLDSGGPRWGPERISWLVEDIANKLKANVDGSASFVLSDSFLSNVDGYRIRLCLHLNGYGDGWGTHLCVSYHLERGEHDDRLEWPFRGSITISIVDQATGEDCCTRTYDADSVPSHMNYVFNRPTRTRNIGWGDSGLVTLAELANGSSLVVKDSLLIKCCVEA